MPRFKEFGPWLLVLVVSIGVLILYVDNKRTRDCIADYMVADQRNAAARFQVTDQERKAWLETMQKIFTPTSTPADRKAAGDAYIALVQKNDEVRKANPLLPVPTECD